MGLLVDGSWHDHWYSTKKTGGRFVRSTSKFRHRLGGKHFPFDGGRYHLYVASACPWAHRTLIYRTLQGLTDAIDISVVSPLMLSEGWAFDDAHPDRLYDETRLHQLYTRADAKYTGRVTVPLLWDTVSETAISNESSEIIRDFEAWGGRVLRPCAMTETIDEVNDWVYRDINNGVYKCGFATSQAAYDDAVTALFAALDRAEDILSRQAYLAGDVVSEADWRLLPTLLRFDTVYVTHFKCDHKRIIDYPNLWDYTRQLAQVPGILDTLDLAETRLHYFASHQTVNPHRIVSRGPDVDFTSPHARGPVVWA